MTSLKWPSLVLATTMMLGFAGAPAVQGQTSQQQAQQQQGASAEDFSTEEVKAFASAAGKVQELTQTMQSRMQSVESREKRQELQQAAREEMIAAIEDEDLSLEQYNQITAALQSDPDLARQVQGYMSNGQ